MAGLAPASTCKLSWAHNTDDTDLGGFTRIRNNGGRLMLGWNFTTEITEDTETVFGELAQ